MGHLMNNVCLPYEIKVGKEDKNIMSDSHSAQRNLADLIQECEESTERNYDSFKKEIEKTLIKRLHEEVEEVQKKVTEPIYIQTIKVDQKLLIDKLTVLDISCTELQQLGVKYRSYMKKLKMPLERFEYLEDLRESLDLRLNLWTSLRD